MPENLPDPISRALEPILEPLAAASAVAVRCEQWESFDNFAVTFQARGIEFMIARDRGQFIVSGPPQAELEAVGLWRAFVGVRELAPPLKAWLAKRTA